MRNNPQLFWSNYYNVHSKSALVNYTCTKLSATIQLWGFWDSLSVSEHTTVISSHGSAKAGMQAHHTKPKKVSRISFISEAILASWWSIYSPIAAAVVNTDPEAFATGRASARNPKQLSELTALLECWKSSVTTELHNWHSVEEPCYLAQHSWTMAFPRSLQLWMGVWWCVLGTLHAEMDGDGIRSVKLLSGTVCTFPEDIPPKWADGQLLLYFPHLCYAVSFLVRRMSIIISTYVSINRVWGLHC